MFDTISFGEASKTTMKKETKQAIVSFFAMASLAAYFGAIRPWHLRWGATDEEIQMLLAGDEVNPDVGIQVTHAITINARPAEIWKWLVQIGQGRGGDLLPANGLILK